LENILFEGVQAAIVDENSQFKVFVAVTYSKVRRIGTYSIGLTLLGRLEKGSVQSRPRANFSHQGATWAGLSALNINMLESY
jgi:hypothetical protein